eukprot:Sspe_Gene.89876::Locus_61548_Transcript_1_1_Confidence_1.000_Length_1388::g.89876::m.89876
MRASTRLLLSRPTISPPTGTASGRRRRPPASASSTKGLPVWRDEDPGSEWEERSDRATSKIYQDMLLKALERLGLKLQKVQRSGEFLQAADDALKALGGKGHPIGVETYAVGVKYLSYLGMYKAGYRYWRQGCAGERGSTLPCTIPNTLLKAAASEGDLAVVAAVWGDMKAMRIRANPATLGAFVTCLIKTHAPRKAIEALEKAAPFLPAKPVPTLLRLHLSALSFLPNALDEATEVVRRFRESGGAVDKSITGAAMRVAARARSPVTAEAIVSAWGEEVDATMWGALLLAYGECRDWGGVQSVWFRMKARGVKADMVLTVTYIEIAAKVGTVGAEESAMMVFEAARDSRRSRLWTAMMSVHAATGNTQGAVALARAFRRAGIRVTPPFRAAAARILPESELEHIR